MPILDDDQKFEEELRRFVPREVAPFPAVRTGRFRWRVSMTVAAAAILVVLGILLWQGHQTPGRSIELKSDVHADGMTLGRTQAALAQARSFEEAIDGMERASRPQAKPQLHRNQSALEALGREQL